ncbi:MAG TPA: ABC transporter substrate-binding protein [Chloroflexota bacterium]|jgi:NitT/TauT family transport system substrate-binding protein
MPAAHRAPFADVLARSLTRWPALKRRGPGAGHSGRAGETPTLPGGLPTAALIAVLLACALVACSTPPAAPSAPAPAAGSAASAPATAAPATAAPAAPAGQPSAAPREAIKVMYVAMGINSTPFWLAKEEGFFDQQGLDVELTYVAGAIQPAQSLTAGDALFSSGGAASVTPARLAGADLVLLGSQVDVYQFQVFTKPEIQRPEQLKGTRMGITRLGAATDWASKAALRYWGMQPTDTSLVQMNGNPEILVGLEAGAIESGMLTDPMTFQARQRGYNMLLDLADTGVHFSPVGLVSTDTIVQQREGTVRRFVRAWIDAIHYLATNKQGSVAIISKYMNDDDLATLGEAYDVHLAKHLRRIPYPSPEAVQTVLDGLADTEPKARDAKPEQFIDDHFIRELDAAGYFRQLSGDEAVSRQ